MTGLKINNEQLKLGGYEPVETFLVDTNDEYDVKKSFRQSKEPETTRKTKKSFDIFKHSETKDTFRILLETISK